ncbi:MAG: hypothetical protein U9Q67_04515 [Patescibacteria group bacterium]|nr:hypothetical protein [Patescibacteria group bacterium]
MSDPGREREIAMSVVSGFLEGTSEVKPTSEQLEVWAEVNAPQILGEQTELFLEEYARGAIEDSDLFQARALLMQFCTMNMLGSDRSYRGSHDSRDFYQALGTVKFREQKAGGGNVADRIALHHRYQDIRMIYLDR